MSKYDPLTAYLTKRGQTRIPMRFADIERVLGFALPPSKSYRAWWSNNAGNNVMTRAWLSAGYRTASVDLGGEKLVFVKSATDGDRGRPPVPANARGRHPAWGALKGTSVVAPGVDLTEPANPEWGKVYAH